MRAAGFRIVRLHRGCRAWSPAGTPRKALLAFGYELGSSKGTTMNLVLARTFLELVNAKNFNKAADRLHVTQSTVTVRIAALEELLGQQLFTREKSGVGLTVAGRKFLPYAELLLQTWQHDLFARQMIRQGTAHRLPPLALTAARLIGAASKRRRRARGFALFQILEHQLKLMDLRIEPFRRATELHPPQLGELGLHLLDLQLGAGQLRPSRRQLGLALGKQGAQLGDLSGTVGHRRESYPTRRRLARQRGAPESLCRTDQQAACGDQVRSGARQSIPSKSIESCAAVSDAEPSFACGHTNRPRSRRLAKRHRPWPSHHRSFTRSPRRPLKAKTAPPCGSSCGMV